MKKITFEELYWRFVNHNQESNVTSQFSDSQFNRLVGVVVFKSENWPEKNYSLESRSYKFVSDNKYFVSGLGGTSIFADSLDGTDRGVRLDCYIREWKIDYCYIEGEEE